MELDQRYYDMVDHIGRGTYKEDDEQFYRKNREDLAKVIKDIQDGKDDKASKRREGN